jgi:predicted transcriptional regulator
MSSTKFASITAGLLARKGEAQPWNHGGNHSGMREAAEGEKLALPWRQYADASSAPPPPPTDKDRSCSLRLSSHDYERLGILAVKTGASRQQLLKQAVAEFLAAKAQAYGCACLGSPGGTCQNNCGSQA